MQNLKGNMKQLNTNFFLLGNQVNVNHVNILIYAINILIVAKLFSLKNENKMSWHKISRIILIFLTHIYDQIQYIRINKSYHIK